MGLRRPWPEQASGRVIDPLGFDAGDSNLYRYVRNNPNSRLDSSGLFGAGISGGGSLDAGIPFPMPLFPFAFGNPRISVQASIGYGLFDDLNKGFNPLAKGANLHDGGYFSFGGHIGILPILGLGLPGGVQLGGALGLYAGVGVGGWVSNTDTYDTLKGESMSASLNFGYKAAFSWNVGIAADGTAVVGILPPKIGTGAGFSVTAYPTWTIPFSFNLIGKPKGNVANAAGGVAKAAANPANVVKIAGINKDVAKNLLKQANNFNGLNNDQKFGILLCAKVNDVVLNQAQGLVDHEFQRVFQPELEKFAKKYLDRGVAQKKVDVWQKGATKIYYDNAGKIIGDARDQFVQDISNGGFAKNVQKMFELRPESSAWLDAFVQALKMLGVQP